MLFSGRLCAGFLPGWLSLVRPREGSQSAGLIIWFEKSGGRGFDKGPLSRAPPPAPLTCVRDDGFCLGSRKQAWVSISAPRKDSNVSPSVPTLHGKVPFRSWPLARRPASLF